MPILNVNPMLSHNSPEFTLQLENEEIILHGTPEESAGVNLRGSVLLKCLEQTKVKSVTLKFVGVTNISWNEAKGSGQRHHKVERKIIEKEWTFLEPKKKSYCLSQGQYKWDFEIPLPGNLPETIDHEFGQITYRFKAYCERPTFSSNLVDRKPIKITRSLFSHIDLTQPVLISNVWANKIIYDISIPTKVYTPNQTIPITFDLMPLAPQLKVKSVNCYLKEYFTCSIFSGRRRTESKILYHICDDRLTLDPDNGHWSKVESLHVEPNRITMDVNGELIQVKHKLKFIVALENEDGHISELRAAIPLVIAPTVPEDDANVLPAYEEALRTTPYYGAQHSSLSSMSLSSSESFSSSDSLLPEPLNWMGMDISRVPSYATALRSATPCYTSPALPNYESISIA